MLRQTPLLAALGLALTGCPSSGESPVPTATPSTLGTSATKAAPTMSGAAPTVAVPKKVEGDQPQVDACGGLVDSVNRCGPVANLSAQVPGDICLPAGENEFNSYAVEHMAWKAFVALSWPTTEADMPDPKGPLAANHQPDGHRTAWQSWRSPEELLQIARQKEGVVAKADWSTQAELPVECSAEAGSLLLRRTGKVGDDVHALGLEGLESVSGGPAIDQNGRAVLVETRMNRTMWDVVVSGRFYEPGRSDRGLSFPNHHGDTAYGTGAMAVQAGWVVIDRVEDGDTSLHVREAYVYQEGNDLRPAVCDKKLVGLVALQVAHKAGVGDDHWVWSVFENTAVAALDEAAAPREYMFQTGGCPDLDADVCEAVEAGNSTEAARCCPNTDLHGRLGPEARLGDDRRPTHLTRLDAWSDSSNCTEAYRDALIGTPWSNFVLVGAQYWQNPDADTVSEGAGPRTLRSLTLEPWAVEWTADGQDTTSSCLGCHQGGDDGIFFTRAMRAPVPESSEASFPPPGSDASPSEPPSAPE